MKSTPADLLKKLTDLEQEIKSVVIPPELKDKVLTMVARLSRMIRFGEYSTEYEKTAHYIDWVINLPWNKRSDDILDLGHAQEILDKHHYGLGDIKERILEYVSVLKLKKGMRAPILCFFGLFCTGQTHLA